MSPELCNNRQEVAPVRVPVNRQKVAPVRVPVNRHVNRQTVVPVNRHVKCPLSVPVRVLPSKTHRKCHVPVRFFVPVRRAR